VRDSPAPSAKPCPTPTRWSKCGQSCPVNAVKVPLFHFQLGPPSRVPCASPESGG
jgi:hypothetical protein